MCLRRTGAAFIWLLACAATAPSHAHGLWISVNVPHGSHGVQQHAVALLGFGHTYPVDELLSLPGDLMQLTGYDIVDPNGQRQSLGLPDLSYATPTETAGGLLLRRGDLGARMLNPGPGAQPGTYQLVAASRPFIVTRYKDRNGELRNSTRSLDELNDAAEIVFSVEFQSAAKAYLHHQRSSATPPLGLELEIIPLGDLSNVRAGDVVEIQVLFHGKALTTDGDFEHVVQASSNSSTLWDGVTLRAGIYQNKARLRLPTPGQWHLFADVREVVATSRHLARYQGKVLTVYHSTSLTIDVKP